MRSHTLSLLVALLVSSPSEARRETWMVFEEDAPIEATRPRPEGMLIAAWPPIKHTYGGVEEIEARLEEVAEAARAPLYDALARAYRRRAAEAWDDEALLECSKPEACEAREAAVRVVEARARARADALALQLIAAFPGYERLDFVMWRLAESYMEQRRIESARRLYSRISLERPDSMFAPYAHIALADLSLEEGEVELALQAYSRVKRRYPSHRSGPYVEYKRAWCYFYLGSFKVAFDTISKMLPLPERDSNENREYFRDLIRFGSYVDEIDLEDLIEITRLKAPELEPQMLKWAAWSYEENGALRVSIQALSRLMEIEADLIKHIELRLEIIDHFSRIEDRSMTIHHLKSLKEEVNSLKLNNEHQALHYMRELESRTEALAAEIYRQHEATKSELDLRDVILVFDFYMSLSKRDLTYLDVCQTYAEFLLHKLGAPSKALRLAEGCREEAPEGSRTRTNLEEIIDSARQRLPPP